MYESLFAALYDRVMSRLEEDFLALWRREMLASAKGVVLDVGAGTGVNFSYYDPRSVELWALEPSTAMWKKAIKKAPRSLELHWLPYRVEDRAAFRLLPEQSVDVVVSTLVLCTVDRPALAVEHFYQWLKPGGKLLLIEHIIAERPWKIALQRLVQPVWTKLACGCHLTRDTPALFPSTRWRILFEECENHWVRWYRAVLQKQGLGEKSA